MKYFNVADLKEDAVQQAVSLVINGGIIALPTDTVYGLACDVQNSEALKHLYEIKKRDLKKPVAICLGHNEQIKYWGEVKHIPPGIFDELLPGPVTIVLEKTPLLNPLLNPGTNKVGIRVPMSSFVRDITNKLGRPLALTSANISNDPSTLSVHEFRPMWHHLSGIFDGGNLQSFSPSRAGSTIVDLSVERKYLMMRDGCALSKTTEVLLKYNLVPL